MHKSGTYRTSRGPVGCCDFWLQRSLEPITPFRRPKGPGLNSDAGHWVHLRILLHF